MTAVQPTTGPRVRFLKIKQNICVFSGLWLTLGKISRTRILTLYLIAVYTGCN